MSCATTLEKFWSVSEPDIALDNNNVLTNVYDNTCNCRTMWVVFYVRRAKQLQSRIWDPAFADRGGSLSSDRKRHLQQIISIFTIRNCFDEVK